MNNGKPTILIFSTAYLPFIGGAELAVKEIADRIKEYDFLMITTRLKQTHPKHERIGSIDVYRVGFGFMPFLDKLLSPFFGAVIARRLMKKRDIRIFWSVMVTFTSGASFLLKIFRMHGGIPILLTLQEGDSEKHLKFARFGFSGLAWFFAMRLADHIQAISNYLKYFAKRMGANMPIDIVPNGIDTRKLQNTNPKSPAGDLGSPLRDYKLQTNHKTQNSKHKTIITASRLVNKNGIDVLIKAFAEVKKEIPDTKLWILGDGAEEKKLKNLAKDLELENNVFFYGRILPDKVYEYLAQADIFVRPSRSEGLGTAFLEAMGVGLPVIGTNAGGIPDFLKDGETGLFCKMDDPRDLADKILLIFRDENLRQKISEQGQELVMKEYSWDNVSQRMKIIFNKLV